MVRNVRGSEWYHRVSSRNNFGRREKHVDEFQ